MRRLKLTELEGIKLPVYIENKEKPELSSWAFYRGKRDRLSAWLLFRLINSRSVAYNMENHGRRWQLWTLGDDHERRAHWLPDDEEHQTGWICSDCKIRACRSHWYCPNCGAYMGEEKQK